MPAAALREAVKRDDGRPLLVGYSGGLDSSVLLHLLANDATARRNGLRAIHVHHGLHADADAWAAHCARECAALGIPLQVVRVDVETDAGLGPEGAARTARHRAFAEALGDDEILALAHHRDDQAETFLLRALRGSGVDGLAAMQPWRNYARGWLWRPLLDVRRDDLLVYAQENALRWIDDPSNADSDFDRNFLRNRVMPLLRERWPHASDNFARSAALSAQASVLLEAEDAQALAVVRREDDALDIDAMRAIPRERRARVLRRWIEGLGLPPLPGNGIERIESELLPAREDTEARFDWAGARVQCWRNTLHAGFILAPLPADWRQHWDGRAPLVLPTGDTLELVGVKGFDAPVLMHTRQGGERIVLPKRRHSHALKHVLQEARMPPWRRERLPLLSDADGTLLAAGDAVLSARMDAWLRARNGRLRWTRLA
ncbi:tRNA lysidine(34) synthetase TilS [Thermomonas sp. HDW16]|uniref:tRNA lysidine(34) synthetase TilS n=1 Tax=Thermomonas sp. HDW16 TaxID=2714945 RepID=UPI00140E7426|nr:tRNA lysidine(34) synthetase TilS [Thermomonas sp. HDW16]QIL20256.1 tRNA lysidine(34) synthetase TilS [Thermomonas sp. HDW16]